MPPKKTKVRMDLSITGDARRRFDALAYKESTTLTGFVEDLINERWHREGGDAFLGHFLGKSPPKRPAKAALKKRRRRMKRKRDWVAPQANITAAVAPPGSPTLTKA